MTQGADDHELLERYARQGDEAAFAGLVRRYVALVYSSAVRRVGNRELAEDVTQAVFMILSRKAKSVPGGKPLSLWLLTTVRYAAANALRMEARRQHHEHSAGKPGVCSADPTEALVWQEIASELDDAVLKLPTIDRRVVLLRYFEDRPIREIAVELNLTEGAVKQRLSRAMEKLRHRLDRSTGGALGAMTAEGFALVLGARAVCPAPAGLSVAAEAAGSIATSSVLTSPIAKGAIKMMGWTKAKIAVSVITAVTLGGGGGVVTFNKVIAQSNAKPAARADKARNKENKADNYLGIATVADAPPVVIETFPKSGADDVDPATTELKVTFSKEMQNGNWSWAQISDATFPQTTGKPHYLDDKRTCVLPVKLEPNHTYVIQLNYPPFDSFMDTDHRKAVRYLLVFQTKG